MPRPALVLLAAALGGCALAGCVPYAVGGGPATIAERRVEPSALVQVASARRDLGRADRPAGAALALANEARLGLDARSDVGVRVTGLGSVTATYKRRLAGRGDAGSALVVGAGVVGASHFHSEATFVVSRGPLPGARTVVPYGGIRVQDLAAFTDDALETPPAVGVFAGARFGWPDLAVSPELGVFYSPSPLAGDRRVVVVPSVSVRGDRLRRALGL